MTSTILLDLPSDANTGVAVITLNRPDKLNALNAELLRELQAAITTCRHDPGVRVVVITGNGPKAFAAGADIAELHAQDAVSGKVFAERGQAVFTAIERLGKPVIAAVNGFALGGGCELAMACHMRFAAESARFGQPEVNLGIIPGYGGTQRLPRLVGLAKAYELVLSGEMIDAAEALRLGLVNRIYAAADLMDQTMAFARLLASKAPLALYACLEATQASTDVSGLEGLYIEASIFGRTCGSQDFKEGTQAFLDKRTPSFHGR